MSNSLPNPILIHVEGEHAEIKNWLRTCSEISVGFLGWLSFDFIVFLLVKHRILFIEIIIYFIFFL
jgi:hypothetical protein